MNFIKLTRVIDPYDVKVGYYGGIQSFMVPVGSTPITYTSTGSSSSGSTTGFLQGLGSLVGLGQQQAQLSQNQQMQQAQHSPLTQAAGQMITYSPTILSQKPQDETQELYIPIDSINYMIAAKNVNYETSLFIINKDDCFFIKESPEQIMKMIHDQGFNKKMDDILK